MFNETKFFQSDALAMKKVTSTPFVRPGALSRLASAPLPFGMETGEARACNFPFEDDIKQVMGQ
jgi:hypothetical protein